MALTLWDFVLAALVLAFLMGLGWLLLWPHGDDWMPEELRMGEADPSGAGPPDLRRG